VELIKQGVDKARTAGPDQRLDKAVGPGASAASAAQWTTPMVQLHSEHLEERRIVSFTRLDPSFIAFNILRTNIYKTLRDNGWKGLAITSPTAGCGKTTVVVNLALSLARQPDCRTVVIDLDLVKPAVGEMLGVASPRSLGQYLDGHAKLEHCFIQTDENLFFALNDRQILNSSETLQDGRIATMLYEIDRNLRPDVMIFDLPPMRVGDDAIAFLPTVQSCLLIAAAGETTAADLRLCQEEIASCTNFLGVVLNKCTDIPKRHYYRTYNFA
jgi:capsular exopolysaccharide synthesis family protein